MKSRFLLNTVTLALSLALCAGSTAFASVATGVSKYKSGNYTGCLNDMQEVIEKDPSNVVAYYYLAMSYAQAGDKMKALENYEKVISINSNAILSNYAKYGYDCLSNPSSCTANSDDADLDIFIAQPLGNGISSEVAKKIEERKIEAAKDLINKNDEVDLNEFSKYRNFNKKKSEALKPTNEQIVEALNVLQSAGISLNTHFAQINPNLAELSMLNGLNATSNSQNGNMMYNMFAGQGNMNPQLMQTLLMNSMNSDFRGL